MENNPVVVEATYHASVKDVWKALTDNDEMKKWYFNLPEFKPEKGFHFKFEGGTESKTYIHLCEITEVIPERKLSHSWRYEGYPGNSIVTFELFPQEDKTTIRVTHEGLETFPSLPDFAKHNFIEGWKAIIGKNLKEFVENNRDI